MPVVGPSSTPPVTVEVAIEQTRSHLHGLHKVTLNRLAQPLTDSDVTVLCEFPISRVVVGSLIGIDTELMYVWSIDPTARSITVQRAMFGSEPGTHDTGVLVEIESLFPRAAIFQALRDEIRSWPDTVYRVDIVDVTASTDVRGYDLAVDDLVNVLRVTRAPLTGSISAANVELDFRLDRTTSPPSLILACSPVEDGAVRALVSRRFDTSAWSLGTDLELDVGLASSMLDIVPLGAAARLLHGREGARNWTGAQGEPRTAEEVPPRALAEVGRDLKRVRDERLREEAGRLLAASVRT